MNILFINGFFSHFTYSLTIIISVLISVNLINVSGSSIFFHWIFFSYLFLLGVIRFVWSHLNVRSQFKVNLHVGCYSNKMYAPVFMSSIFVFLITHIWWHLILSFSSINHYSAILFNNIFHFFSTFFVFPTNSQSSITCVLNQSISFGVPKCNIGVYWPIKDTRKSHNCDWSFVFPSIVTDRMLLGKGASDEKIVLLGIHCPWCVFEWCCEWSIYRENWAFLFCRSCAPDNEFFQQPKRKAPNCIVYSRKGYYIFKIDL